MTFGLSVRTLRTASTYASDCQSERHVLNRVLVVQRPFSREKYSIISSQVLKVSLPKGITVPMKEGWELSVEGWELSVEG